MADKAFGNNLTTPHVRQFTELEAGAIYDSNIWQEMSELRRAQFQFSQELSVMPNHVFNDAVEKVTGRPVFTTTFLDENVWNNLKAQVMAIAPVRSAWMGNTEIAGVEQKARLLEYKQHVEDVAARDINVSDITVKPTRAMPAGYAGVTQLSVEEAQAFNRSGVWKKMDDLSKVIFQMDQNFLVMPHDEYIESADRILLNAGKPSLYDNIPIAVWKKSIREISENEHKPAHHHELLSKTTAVANSEPLLVESFANTSRTVSFLNEAAVSVGKNLSKVADSMVTVAASYPKATGVTMGALAAAPIAIETATKSQDEINHGSLPVEGVNALAKGLVQLAGGSATATPVAVSATPLLAGGPAGVAAYGGLVLGSGYIGAEATGRLYDYGRRLMDEGVNYVQAYFQDQKLARQAYEASVTAVALKNGISPQLAIHKVDTIMNGQLALGVNQEAETTTTFVR